MTNWLPDLTTRPGPKYQAIAAALADDIAEGRLEAGERLPTHRDLAWRLGVTVGTVSRAYALARSWGLVTGEVGRGTRVLPVEEMQNISPAEALLGGPVPPLFPAAGRRVIEMSRNYPVDPQTDAAIAAGMSRLANPAVLRQLGGYQPPAGTIGQRRAGAQWLAFCGVQAEPESLIVTTGCQHALWLTFVALAGPGETVLTEDLTWPGVQRLAELVGLRVRAIAMDGDGMRPDALEDACRATQPRIIYTIPTQQNPTACVMSETRRREIIEIARRHSVTIVEDGVFEFLVADAPSPIAALAPDITVHASSLSKAVSPALRTGFLAAPQAMIPRLAAVIQTTTIMPPTFGSQLSAELIASGAVVAAAERQRTVAAERTRAAARILGGGMTPTHANASQIWLRLPDQWDSRSFAAEALSQGVAVTPGDAFCADPTAGDPRAVRVCLCAEASGKQVEDGLHVVARLVASHPTASTPIV